MTRSWEVEVSDQVVDWIAKLRKGAGPQAVAAVRAAMVRLAEVESWPADLVHKIRGDVWELRATWRRNPYRILFYNPSGRRLVLLVAFHKTTDSVPASEIERAERMIDRLEGGSR